MARAYSPRKPVAERREELLDAALALLARDGYHGLSIDAVAREAGVTRPVVYRVFAGLAELLGELLDREEQRALAHLGAVDLTDPEASIRELIDAVRGAPGTWRPILFADRSPAPVRERVARDRALVVGALAGALRRELPRGADADVVAEGLIAAAEHFGRRLLDDPGLDPAPLVATVRAFVRGARAPRPGTRRRAG